MTYFMNAKDVSQELQISRSSAYKVIRQLNDELQKKGYLIVNGKIPKNYFVSRYCLTLNNLE